MTGLSEGAQAIVDAIIRSGRFYRLRNGELETRCPFCGDSRKSSTHAHFYLNLTAPHPCYCQRCSYKAPHVTTEILEALNAAERDAAVYVRTVVKESRHSRNRRQRADFGTVSQRKVIPQPDRSNPDDAAAIGYIEKRLGGPPLSEAEIQRYKIITCGLYGFLELNGIDQLTVKNREGDRLNETCVGFLTADESYIIFRSMDDEYVAHGGLRYTNYRIHPEWEGSKMFAARSDVDLLAPTHTVAITEGIIDLIQVERLFHAEQRWLPNHIALATCGTAHDLSLGRLPGLGILSMSADVYIDDEEGLARKARRIPLINPFFRTSEFSMRIWKNSFVGPDPVTGQPRKEKDFGVLPERISRVPVSLREPARSQNYRRG